MRVGVVQFRATKGDSASSRARLLALGDGAPDGLDLLVLPEMAVTGYVFPTADAVRAVAERPDGPTAEALGALAKRRRSWVVCGFAEDAGDRLYNSAFVFDRDGRLAFVYRKTCLYEADVPWATPGDSGYAAFDSGTGRFGVGICMDLNDDAFLAWVSGERPAAIAFPTNWVVSDAPFGPPEHEPWTYWAARLGSSRAALVAGNTWGEDGAVGFTGRSAVLRARVVHAALPARGDGVAVAEIPSAPEPW